MLATDEQEKREEYRLERKQNGFCQCSECIDQDMKGFLFLMKHLDPYWQKAKEDFKKAYNNVPYELRTTEIICVIKGRPYTFEELATILDTLKGFYALKQLKDLSII